MHNNESMEFWEQIDDKILDLIQLIRSRHTRFNGTPVEKVILNLLEAYKASGKVAGAIDKGWIQ
jgi:hypothetical protein